MVSAVYDEIVPNQDWKNYDHVTHYSYDIHGNVSKLWKEFKNEPYLPSDQRIKVMEYTYDLISGKINTLDYMKNEPDWFRHRYSYDSDNRITRVETSRDNVNYC
jgi:YD repeat-containing protein